MPNFITDNICYQYLIAERKNFIKNEIWPGKVTIINRMLDENLNMSFVYREILDKTQHSHQCESVLSVIINAGFQWSREATGDLRRQKKALATLNHQISEVSRTLASLLDQRSEIANSSGVVCESFDCITEAIAAASEDNHFYHSNVEIPLRQLSDRFDLKHWPSIADVARAISDNSNNMDTYVRDSSSAAAIDSLKHTTYDYFRGILSELGEAKKGVTFPIPRDFSFTDTSLATIANCSMELEEEVVGGYVKRFRQSMREKASGNRISTDESPV